MAEPLLSVALLFDDADLGGHLREALMERGVQIAHEGPLAAIDADELRRIDPDVLVVNLDENDDDAFDHLYSMIEGERPRLVVNDAQASRMLAGWDRARWARHLAVKVLARGDVDPPRPAGAVDLAPVAPVAPPPSAADVDAGVAAAAPAPAVADTPAPEPVPDVAAPGVAALADLPEEPVHDLDDVEQLLATPIDLEAELAALLAAEPLPLDAEEPPAAPIHELPLNDGDFSTPMADVAPTPTPAVAPPPLPDTSGLELVMPDAPDGAAPAPAAAPSPAPVAAPDWGLVDDTALSAAPISPASESFAVQKLSAADFLAPDVEPVAPDIEPKLTLELVSLEEAVAPQEWVPHEMLLDDLGSMPRHVVLVGAAADGIPAVGDFLAGIPAGSSLTLLIIVHFGAQSAEDVLDHFAAQAKLPIRLAADGDHARAGEALLAPAGSVVQVRRDGSIELRATEGAVVPVPPIDAAFSMAANAFGRDAVGIVFAGASTDAVAGAQAIHDRGGQIWVEAANGEHYDDMVGAIFAERLVSHSGTPRELAAHLIEVYP